jgi:putative oxidoreductase
MLKKLLSNEMLSTDAIDWAALILRVSSGVLMLTHGYPKMQKLFAGGEIQFADPIFIGMTASLALTVFAEVICSVFIILGLWTRLALIPLIITMLVAVLMIHASDPLDVKEHGLLYLFPYLATFLLGSGKFSVDNVLSKR